MITEHDTDVAGVRVHWAEAGAGDDPPYLLIHGLGSSSAKFLDALGVLSSSRRAIAIDLPGFGRSDAPNASYSPAWVAGGVRAFLDAIGVERAVVVGNSYGGLVGAYLAARWPERCVAAVLVAPVLPNDGPQPPAQHMAGFLLGAMPGIGPAYQARYWQRSPAVIVAESLARNCVDPSRVDPETVRRMEEDAARKGWTPDLRRANFRAQRQVLWAVSGRRESTWNTLRSIGVPTLLLWGEKDRVLPVHIGRAAVERLPGAQLIVLDDCGHNPQMERPREFSAAVSSFVRAAAVRARG